MPNNVASRRMIWSILGGVVIVDRLTKMWAVDNLSPFPDNVLGEWLAVVLVYNRGAAFGIGSGTHSRLFFSVLAVVALIVLAFLIKQTPPIKRLRIYALACISGGALGNLIDRVFSARGVVDFVDIGFGLYRLPTFNVADVAVAGGAFALAMGLWRYAPESKDSRGSNDAPGSTPALSL